MQIILLERVPKLGQMGEVFGSSRLRAQLPDPDWQGAAGDEDRDRRLRAAPYAAGGAHLERKQDAQKLASQVDGKSVVILRQASETGQYGRRSTPATSPPASPKPASRSTASRSG